MMDPLLTVILPVYNAELYLKECLESLKAQSFRDFEVLIFDDASTDRSHGILMAFDDPRFHVERSRQNQGYAVYLNQGIEKARGRYIARMDADDICYLDRFQKQIDFLEKNPHAGICGTAYEVFGDADTKVFQKPLTNEAIRWMCLFDNPFQHPTVMIRRSLLVDHSLRYNEDLMPTEDYELWSRLLQVTEGANLPEPLLRYRFHSGQESSAKRARQLQIHQKVSEQNIKNFFLKTESSPEKRTVDAEWGIRFWMGTLSLKDDHANGLRGYWDFMQAYFSKYPNEMLEREEKKRVGKFLLYGPLSGLTRTVLWMKRPALIGLSFKRVGLRVKQVFKV
ncbi:MAG: glycosyltransferase family 2 protein [Verrucomicrobiota bacterium]